jgi:glutathione S-transferase
VGTLSELIASLAACSPQRWSEKRHALRSQLARALTAAARKLEPTVQPVTPPRRLVRSEADLDAWLAEVRAAVLSKLPAGPVQL